MSSRLSMDFPRRGQASTRPSAYTQPYDPPRAPSALYHDDPEDQDEPFDVRADFDGEGPRWSDFYGLDRDRGEDSTKGTYRDDRSYRPLTQNIPPTGMKPAPEEEMISVPVLGPEWQKSELHEMSRRGQTEIRRDGQRRAWREWTRDQRGMFGVPWLTRRVLVFAFFFLCVAVGITLFFVIPRAPSFTFYDQTPFTVDNSTVSFSRSPTNFSFSGNLNLYADASSSYIPVHFHDLYATLYDLNTEKAIATGNWGDHSVKHKDNQPVVLPVEFSYSALNDSDTTWNDVYNACGHIWPGTQRTDLKFRLVLQMSIVGLVTKPSVSTELSDIACPFELSANSV